MRISNQAFGYLVLAAAVLYPFAAAIYGFDAGAVLRKIVTAVPVLLLLIAIPLGVLALLAGLFRRG
jgi:hypothetical protein